MPILKSERGLSTNLEKITSLFYVYVSHVTHCLTESRGASRICSRVPERDSGISGPDSSRKFGLASHQLRVGSLVSHYYKLSGLFPMGALKVLMKNDRHTPYAELCRDACVQEYPRTKERPHTRTRSYKGHKPCIVHPLPRRPPHGEGAPEPARCVNWQPGGRRRPDASTECML